MKPKVNLSGRAQKKTCAWTCLILRHFAADIYVRVALSRYHKARVTRLGMREGRRAAGDRVRRI